MTSEQAHVYERAARDMRERHGPVHPRHRFWSALADFLAGCGRQLAEAGGRYGMCDEPAAVQAAATLAAAYLESLRDGQPARASESSPVVTDLGAARRLLGETVVATLAMDPRAVVTGTLLAAADSGEVVIRSDDGFLHYCWPMLDISPVGLGADRG